VKAARGDERTLRQRDQPPLCSPINAVSTALELVASGEAGAASGPPSRSSPRSLADLRFLTTRSTARAGATGAEGPTAPIVAIELIAETDIEIPTGANRLASEQIGPESLPTA